MIKYKITGFKLSQLLTAILKKKINTIREEPEKANDCLKTGISYLIQKSGDSKEVRNCRPITCLKTMYKILTGIRAKRISTHLEEQSLLPAEQKRCQTGSKNFKDQLMISNVIYEDSRRRNRNLSIALIDYQKALGSVPHSWVEKSIALVGVNSKIVRFCKLFMEKWNTRLFKNKAGSNAVTTHSDTTRNIPRGLTFAITF